MAGSLGSSRSFSFGLLASVTLHVAGVVGFSRVALHGGDHLPSPSARSRALEPLEIPPVEEPRRLVLGVEDSPHQTETWLGFKDPTEHRAPLAPVEQAAMDPAAGAPNKPVPPPASSPGEAPTPAAPPARERVEVPVSPDPAEAVAASAPSEAQDAEAPRAIDDSARPNEALPPPLAVSGREDIPAGTQPEQVRNESAERAVAPPAESPAPAPDLNAAKPSAPAPAVEHPGPPAPEPARGAHQPGEQSTQPSAPASEPGERPGEKSDRQSTPAALTDTIDVKLGRPAAAQGLDIKTVRPTWSETTRLMSSPRNPIVRVTFARSGHVTRAEFLPGHNTGSRAVDEPLIDALYRWTARGAALRALPLTKDAGLTVQFRIMLR